MSGRLTAVEQAVVEQARAWVAARVPARTTGAAAVWGQGPDHLVGVATRRGVEEQAEIAEAQRWQAALFDAGFAWVDGPVEYGGRGLSPAAARAVRRVLADYDVPNTGCFIVSFSIVGPTVLAHGTPAQRATWLPRIWRGDVICCQLFSEVEAGSDLAGLRTTATRDGDEWVLRGHKVWSSGAHYSALGELLARTGTLEDRHRGITAFLVEMDRPGIEVRPLRQMSGSEHFNEVYFDDVRIPDANRLGELDGGWRVAQTTLGGEREVMGEDDNGIFNAPVRRLFELAEHLRRLTDGDVAALLADAYARERVLHLTAAYAAEHPVAGSIAKLQTNALMATVVAAADRLLGERLVVDDGSWGTFAWSDLLLAVPAHRIAGGTDEIQRNIIAERALGLPRDPRPTTNGSG